MKIPIVNEQDEIIAYKDRYDRNPDDIIRVAALWLVNEKDEILLARRALFKKYHPGLWSLSVAGTVEEGETYESNIIKEAEEEVGLKNIQPKFLSKDLFLKNEKRDQSMYVSHYILNIPSDTVFILKEDEVAEVEWLKKEDIIKKCGSNPELFAPGFQSGWEVYLKNN